MKLSREETVAEIQGYYGSLNIAEKVFQRIWVEQDFDDSKLLTQKGKPLRILFPGKWNHNEGPDFMGAKVQIAEDIVCGDVELHLYPQDWNHHQHSRDPHFEKVFLHVTLFNGDSPSGRCAPDHHLVLLPYLKQDLEEMLTQYAMTQSARKDPRDEPWVKVLLSCGAGATMDQYQLLCDKSKIRWDLKVRYAEQRIYEYGWVEACHQMMLEVLGYRRNRSTMHQIALKYPLKSHSPKWSPEDVFNEHRSEWKLQGVRPANHPLHRLEAYHKLISEHPDWPQSLLVFSHRWSKNAEKVSVKMTPNSNSLYRRETKMHLWIKKLRSVVFQDQIGGSRIHTLFCDALLPLLASISSRAVWRDAWFTWPVGDYPKQMHEGVRLLPLAALKGASNSNGWMQGCLQIILENQKNDEDGSSERDRS